MRWLVDVQIVDIVALLCSLEEGKWYNYIVDD